MQGINWFKGLLLGVNHVMCSVVYIVVCLIGKVAHHNRLSGGVGTSASINCVGLQSVLT